MPQLDKDSVDRSPESVQHRSTPIQTGIFSRNGEFWTLGYHAATFSLRDIKGFSYIQQLLRHPGEEFHVLDLLTEPGTGAEPESSKVDVNTLPVGVTVRRGLSGDAGEILDAQAKREYKQRIDDLTQRMEDLRERGDHAALSEAESEYDFLMRQLSYAVGRGGRERRAGSIAERARLNVQRAIKAALLKSSEHHAEFGQMLNRSIKTGLFCSYAPDRRAPIKWQFSLESAGPEPRGEDADPILFRRETSFLRAFTGGTEFVGRETERAALGRALEQAIGGQGKVVLIGGAAGVGKTRLAAEIGAEALRQGILTYVGSCYERDDPVPYIPFVEILEAALAYAPSPAAFRQALAKDASELARLLPRLQRLFPDIPPPMELPPEQSRRNLFGAIAELLARNARNTPILMLLDDLHWADEATVSLLNYLAQLVPKMRVLIVGTYRDFQLAPSSPLTRTFDELIHLHLVERINLAGLPRDAVTAMLRALSGREPPELVARLFYADTEGNPFFVEELFRHLVELGKLTDSAGEFRRDLKFSDLDVPQSLRLLIGRRLMRLSDSTQKTLAIAAVIGRSFTVELLAASAHAEAESLLDCVEEAERGGLISSAIEYPEVQFRFSHELIRQAVAQTLSAVRRQWLHLDVANAVESVYAETLDDHANDLAHHLWEAGALADPQKTIRYLSMAAKRVRLQGALTEAGEFYRDALMLLKKVPDTPERDQLELGLQLGIGTVLMATRGYADAETAGAHQRATALGERLGDPTRVVLALTGLSTLPLLRGQLDSAQALADQALAVSQRHGKSKTQTFGYYVVGVVQYHSGHLASAWDHLSQAHALYREEEHRKTPQDPGIEGLEYMALTAWQLGMADTARARSHDAISLSARIQKPFGLARSSFYAAYLQVLLRDPEAVRKFSEKAIEYSIEYSIPLYLDASRIVYGWAIAQQGRRAEGVACTRAAVESYKAAGNRLAIGSFLGFLAEAQLSAGLPEEAMTAVEQGFSLAPQEPFDISYLWWLRGKLLLENTGPKANPQTLQLDKSRLEDAEKSFRKAVSVAESIGAKSYEIRSATSLGKLLAANGRATEARAIVEPLLKSMTEGFDTREFVEAKQLMEELS